MIGKKEKIKDDVMRQRFPNLGNQAKWEEWEIAIVSARCVALSKCFGRLNQGLFPPRRALGAAQK